MVLPPLLQVQRGRRLPRRPLRNVCVPQLVPALCPVSRSGRPLSQFRPGSLWLQDCTSDALSCAPDSQEIRRPRRQLCLPPCSPVQSPALVGHRRRVWQSRRSWLKSARSWRRSICARAGWAARRSGTEKVRFLSLSLFRHDEPPPTDSLSLLFVTSPAGTGNSRSKPSIGAWPPRLRTTRPRLPRRCRRRRPRRLQPLPMRAQRTVLRRLLLAAVVVEETRRSEAPSPSYLWNAAKIGFRAGKVVPSEFICIRSLLPCSPLESMSL